MKARNILFVLFLFCSSICFAQDNLFEKYSEMDNVTSVYISKSMFNMIPDGTKTGSVDFSELKGKVDNLQILTSERKSVKEQMQADFGGLVDKSYELMMKVKSDDTRTSFFTKQQGEMVKELIMLTDDTDDYVVIRLQGDFTIEDIQKIAKSME